MLAYFVTNLGISGWRAAARPGVIVWIFPAMILLGSGTRPLLLAAIHAGDWLAKLLLTSLILGSWRENRQESKGIGSSVPVRRSPEVRRRRMSELRTLMDGLAFGESPRWHDGRLWFADWGTQEVIAVDTEGKSEVVVSMPSFPFSIDRLAVGAEAPAAIVGRVEHQFSSEISNADT